MKKFSWGFTTALSIFLLAGTSHGYVLSGKKWPGPSASFFVHVTDGSSGDWDTPFTNAMAKWSSDTIFKYSVAGATAWDPCSNPSSGAKNGAKFSDTVCGDAWGATTLAIARRWSTDQNILVQAGVLVNTKYTWAVYDDPWETGSFVDKADFQRVALHELGHCLGLDHEDDVPAIMGTAVSTGTTIIDPQPDDINGVQAIYGVSGSISESIFVPIVLSAAGLNGSFFSSEMSVSNRGDTSATVEFVYTAAYGQGSGTVTDSIAAGQQRIVKDAIAYLRTLGLPIPSSGSQGGTLRVNFSGLSAVSDGAVSVRTTTIIGPTQTAIGGRAGLAYAGIPISQCLTTTAYISGLRQNSTDRSNIAVQNVGSSSDGDITLRVTVFSGDVTHPQVSQLPDIILQPGGFQQISGILGSVSLANGYVRVERMSGTASYFAYGVINDQANSDGSFILPILDSSLTGKTRLTLPVIVETSAFSSEIVATNWSSTKKTLDCRFIANGIQAADATAHFQISLNPSEQLIIPDFVQYLRAQAVAGIGAKGPAFAGALFASISSSDLSGVSLAARTSTPGGGGRYGLFYSSVPNGSASTTSAWIYDLQQDSESRSNLALVNTGEQDGSGSTFQIDLFDGNTGGPVGSITNSTPLSAGMWTQIGTILAQYAPGTSQGYAHITLKAGTNPFIVYGVINDGNQPGARTGDGAFLASAP
jgi:hypothetical protein